MKNTYTFFIFLALSSPFTAMAIPHCDKEMDKSEMLSAYKAVVEISDDWYEAYYGHQASSTRYCGTDACFNREKPNSSARATSQIGYGKVELEYEVSNCEKIIMRKYKMSLEDVVKSRRIPQP